MSTFDVYTPPETSIEAFKRLISGPGARFTGADFRSLCTPLVYMFLLDGKPLYVGMSENGLQRPISTKHHKRIARDRCNEVLIWPTRTKEDALELERILIGDFCPRYNDRATRRYFVPTAEMMGVPARDLARYKKAALDEGDRRARKVEKVPEKPQQVVVLRSHDNADHCKRVA